jgi:hypothetical protein
MNDELPGSDTVKPMVVRATVVHACLLVLFLLFLFCGKVYLLVMMEALCVNLPTPTRIFINLSQLLRAWMAITIPMSLLALYLDATLYGHLLRTRRVVLATLWFWTVTATFAALVVFELLAFAMPVFRLPPGDI